MSPRTTAAVALSAALAVWAIADAAAQVVELEIHQ
jgi:hypothetical protein